MAPTVPGQNKRDWAGILKAAKDGNLDLIPEDILFNKMPTVMSHRVFNLSDTDEVNLWYYGDAGTGKSRKARSDNVGAYMKTCNKWWDGYNGQDVVVIEDFGKKAAEHLNHHMKIWADRYYFPAEIKGGMFNIRPRRIIVTSNYHPRDLWFDVEGELQPILRRFKCVHFANIVGATIGAPVDASVEASNPAFVSGFVP